MVGFRKNLDWNSLCKQSSSKRNVLMRAIFYDLQLGALILYENGRMNSAVWVKVRESILAGVWRFPDALGEGIVQQ